MIKTHKKLIRLFLCSIVLFMCFLFANTTFAGVSSPSDLTGDLTTSEEEEIADYEDLRDMISDIFELSDDRGTEDLSNPIKLMYSLIGRVLVYFNDFVTTTPYKLVVGLAFILLTANFTMKIYEESSAGINIHINSNFMIRQYVAFIFALLLIFNLKSIVYFILGFFKFILKLCINSTDSNFLGEPEELIDAINPTRVAYEVLKEKGIVKSSTLLDEVIVRSKESAVRTTFMIPWVFSWISKMALIVVIFVNSIKLLVHSIFYVVSLGDFFKDIKKSKFIEYTKVLIALALEESVIIIILYISNMLLNPYLYDLLKEGVTGTSKLTFINLAMIFTGVQMARVIAIISSNAIAKRILGVA